MKTYKSYAKEYTLKVQEGKHQFHKAKIASSKDAYDYATRFYYDDIGIYESFFIMLINRANNVTGWAKISQGGTAGTVVDLKLIAKYAIESLSSGIIAFHNHPSNSVKPSENDIKVTSQIKNSLWLFNISLLDHIILIPDDTDYYSFCDNEKL